MATPDAPPDRRRTRRVESDLQVTLTAGTHVTPARLRNISTVGLRCTLTTPIAELTRVRLGFQLANGVQEIEGAVVRCEQGDHGLSSWDVAVYFTGMSQTVRDTLGSYLSSKSAG